MKLSFDNGEKRTYGVLECLLSTLLFFSPNFLLLLPYFKENNLVFLFYNFVIIFLIVSAMAHFRFRE